MSKTIAIKVPDWTRFVTIDKFGIYECWENEPETWPGGFDGRWHNKVRGRRKQLMQIDSETFPGWRKSLLKI